MSIHPSRSASSGAAPRPVVSCVYLLVCCPPLIVVASGPASRATLVNENPSFVSALWACGAIPRKNAQTITSAAIDHSDVEEVRIIGPDVCGRRHGVDPFRPVRDPAWARPRIDPAEAFAHSIHPPPHQSPHLLPGLKLTARGSWLAVRVSSRAARSGQGASGAAGRIAP